jgi:hypothetical protein
MNFNVFDENLPFDLVVYAIPQADGQTEKYEEQIVEKA